MKRWCFLMIVELLLFISLSKLSQMMSFQFPMCLCLQDRDFDFLFMQQLVYCCTSGNWNMWIICHYRMTVEWTAAPDITQPMDPDLVVLIDNTKCVWDLVICIRLLWSNCSDSHAVHPIWFNQSLIYWIWYIYMLLGWFPSKLPFVTHVQDLIRWPNGAFAYRCVWFPVNIDPNNSIRWETRTS